MRLPILCLFVLFLTSCASDTEESSSQQPSTAQFSEVSARTSGIEFSNDLIPSYDQSPLIFDYFYSGAGVGIGDLNGDGHQDVFFTSNQKGNKLYFGDGQMHFEDVTSQSGILPDSGWYNGVALVDIEGDGDLDIYLCKAGYIVPRSQRTNVLYINDGKGQFTEQAEAFGLDDTGYSTQSYFFDYDQDGDLDALVLNRPNKWYASDGDFEALVASMTDDNKDHFYIQEDGKFVESSTEVGIGEQLAFGLSAGIVDFNGDGWLDIYIANDYINNDQYYENQGNGTFVEKIRSLTNHTPWFAMGSDWADLNNDGLTDGFVAEMLPKDYKRAKTTMMPMMNSDRFEATFGPQYHYQYMRNSLYHNNGNGFLSDIAQYGGVQSSDWSWAVLAQDFDQDGWKDIFITNGFRYDFHHRDMNEQISHYLEVMVDPARAEFVGDDIRVFFDPKNLRDNPPPIQEMLDMLPSEKIPNVMYHNKGSYQFEDVAKDWGLGRPGFSNGAAVGDLDGDGDLDLVINNVDAPASIYRNEAVTGKGLRVELEGPSGNSYGIGSELRVYSGEEVLTDRLIPMRGYLSSCEPKLHIGLGDGQVDRLEVIWPDGRLTSIAGDQVEEKMLIKYSEATGQRKSQDIAGLFTETTEVFSEVYEHEENDFRDYTRQVLLPHKFSQEGPSLTVGDINGDGLDDVHVGGAQGYAGAIYLQTKAGKLVRQTTPLLEADKRFEDVGSALADVDGDGDLDLYVSSGGVEYDLESDGYQDRLYINEGGKYTSRMELPKMNINGSVVAAHDVDRDGKSEIFVGGGPLKDLYPYPNSSFLLKNFGDGKMTDITSGSIPGLQEIGIVRDAAWVDLDGQGAQELVIVGEWMPITIFSYQNGGFQNVTSQYGLDKSNGWWFSVTSGDLDGDGDEDLLVGNLGKNYKFKASEKKPFEVFSSDFDSNGTYDVVLAKHLESGRMVPIRGRDCTSEQMPYITDKFKTFEEFASADVGVILGGKQEDALHMKAYTFETVVLENTGGGFKRHVMPSEVQWSPVRGVVMMDVNGDGKKDMMLGGNMFPTEPETSRADASPGCVLINKGGMEFEVMGPRESGFFIPEDVRKLEAVKVGGQSGVLVGINEGPLKFFNLK